MSAITTGGAYVVVVSVGVLISYLKYENRGDAKVRSTRVDAVLPTFPMAVV